MRCDGCKHWDLDDAWHKSGSFGAGDVFYVVTPDRPATHRMCNRLVVDGPATVAFGSTMDTHGDIFTAAHFGCVMFKKVEEK